jgi:hypothetical protein
MAFENAHLNPRKILNRNQPVKTDQKHQHSQTLERLHFQIASGNKKTF